MDYIPDYNDLFAEHDAEEARALAKLPKCDICGEPIQDEHFYDIDGTYFCEECLNEEYRRKTDDYLED